VLFYKNKKILVTGASGFIGTNLIKELLYLGADVTGILHKNSPQIDFDCLSIKYLWGDLTDKEFCKKICKNQDFVFMCAADSHGALYIEKNPLELVTSNVVMNSLMLEASYDNNVKKFIFISSSTVYPDVDILMSEDMMKSGFLFEKYFGVAWMKIFTEKLCEMYSTKIKDPMKTIIVRPANAYGPYDDFEWETSHMVPSLIRKVVEKKNPIEVWGDGNDVKDLIYIDDLVEGLLLSADSLEEFTILNVATGKSTTVADVLNCILEIEGCSDKIAIKFDESKPTMIPIRLIDTAKSKKILGYEFNIDIKDGVKKTIKWYKEYYKK
jgi:GDP-L-fucose synthase